MSVDKAMLDAHKAVREAGLAEAREILISKRDGLQAAKALSAAQDRVIISAFSELTASVPGEGDKAGFCLCATGGYGRAELAPGSDIDLLLLHQGNPPKGLEQAYSDLLYMLWDMGLKVGHALRQPGECVQIAVQDPVSATAMMDVRVLIGNGELATELHEVLVNKSSARADRAFIAAKLTERDKRHARFGWARYMVEPHIKDGKGGLRDLQTLGWLARRLRPECTTARQALSHSLDEQSLRQYDRALRFMWTVRFWLHLITGRSEDRLGFDLQPELARIMGYRDTPAVERLMKAYFLKVRDVGMLTRVFCTRLETIAVKRTPTGLSRFLTHRREALKVKGFVTEAGRLDYKSEKIVSTDPVNLLRLFEVADAIGSDIHPNALHTIAGNLSHIKAGFRHDPAAAKVFLNCLTKAKDPQTLLRIMSENGVLGRYIPEFGKIVGRTQFDMYHRYTVDEHSLRAIGVVHALLQESPKIAPQWTAPLARALENRRALYLAMLLHDTGKGKGDQQIAGAQSASQACTRLGIPPEETRLVSWLVGHHLLMSDTAQQRDLGDPHTILDFAKIVQTPERLRLLTLLTIADISAVGPEVWNGWKDRLLHELFEATESLFRGKAARGLEILQQASKTRADTAREDFLASCTNKPFAQTWANALGPSYWASFDPEIIIDQGLWAAELAKSNVQTGVFLAAVPSDSYTVMRVLAEDVPGLFSKLCGAVSATGGNIAGARIFTTNDDRAFDVFYIQDHEGHPFGQDNSRAITRLETMIQKILTGETLPKITPQAASRRASVFAVTPSVVFDNEASAHQSVIETSGRDRPGLLHDLAHVLWQSRLNIRSAHIVTYGARAVDVFYVHEEGGGKITNTRRLNSIGAKLRAVLQIGQNDDTPSPHGQAPISERR